MKKVFFFLLLPSMLCGQIVVKDSTWQSNSNGLFYENRLVEYSNGELFLNRRLLGDSVSIFNEYLRAFQSESNRIANLAFEARNFDKEIGAMLSRRDSVLLSLNKDLTDTIAAKSAAPLLQNGWAIFEDGASLDVVFTINNQGQLRYQIAGFPARNCFLVGRAMRLQNYKDTGAKLDLYNAPGGNWFDITDKVKMRLPGNQGLNRSNK